MNYNYSVKWLYSLIVNIRNGGNPMKKTLSVVLAMLVLFSMTAFMASAEGELVTVKFFNDGVVVKEAQLTVGANITDLKVSNPSKTATETTEYTFKGWRCSLDGELYYENTLPVVPADATEITFTAEYAESNVEVRQTFWNLIESIFARINLIFQYFAKVFEW